MKGRVLLIGLILLSALWIPTTLNASAADNPFLGRWALTIPGGGAGYLHIWQEKGYMDGDILWGGGSVVPLSSVCMASEENDMLVITRTRQVQRRSNNVKRELMVGNEFKPNNKGIYTLVQYLTDTIIARVDGDYMDLTIYSPHPSGKRINENQFSGKRIPKLPPAPDLSKVKYGEPIKIFNGKDLEGWELMGHDRVNGWSVEDGVLVNNPVQKQGEPHIPYGNLRTEKKFEDFKLKLDVNIPEGSNSGIYLRGIYEIQVLDSYNRPLDSHHMGAVYSRIAPTVSAEKPAGEWQSMEITLCDRHVTVVLNGKTIIDNKPLLGCTGGAITSNEFAPGPIYLQGDHGKVSFRNMELIPIVEE